MAALADLVFLCGWAGFLSYADSHVQVMDAHIDWLLRTLQVIGALGAIGTIAALYVPVHSLRDPRALFWEKASDAMVALARNGATRVIDDREMCVVGSQKLIREFPVVIDIDSNDHEPFRPHGFRYYVHPGE